MACRAAGYRKHGTLQTVESTLDSGAAEVVAPPIFAVAYKTRSSAGSGSSAKHRTASGNAVINQGERNTTMAEGADTRIMPFQVADVIQPLAPAGGITSRGHGIVSYEEDSHTQHKETGRSTKQRKEGNVFVMRMKIMPPGNENRGQDEKQENA